MPDKEEVIWTTDIGIKEMADGGSITFDKPKLLIKTPYNVTSITEIWGTHITVRMDEIGRKRNMSYSVDIPIAELEKFLKKVKKK